MEFESILWGVLCCGEDAERLEDGDDGLGGLSCGLDECYETYGCVIVGARSAAGCRVSLVD